MKIEANLLPKEKGRAIPRLSSHTGYLCSYMIVTHGSVSPNLRSTDRQVPPLCGSLSCKYHCMNASIVFQKPKLWLQYYIGIIQNVGGEN